MGCGSSKTTVYDDAFLARPTVVVKPEHSLSGASIIQCSGCGDLYSSAMNTAFCNECTFKLERAARQQSRTSSGELDTLTCISSISLTRPMDHESDHEDTQLENSNGIEITELDEKVLSVPVSDHRSRQDSIVRIMYTIPEVSEENSREVTPAPSKYNQLLQHMISVTVEDQETGFKEEIFKQVSNDHQTSQITHSTSEIRPRKDSQKESKELANGVTVNGERKTNDCNKLRLPESNAEALPESYAAALPESNAAALPESYAAALPESNAAALPESYAAALPESKDVNK